MKYASYAAVVKGKKISEFKMQDLHVAVRDKMREYLLPEEIIAMIFVMVYSKEKKKIPLILDYMNEKHSIWWKPSYRLRDLCSERGALQPHHYDLWTIFPSYIPFRDHKRYDGYSAFDDEDEVDEEVEQIFNERRFNDESEYGCCSNCVAYQFPCKNCSDYQSCTNSHIWDISDEPRVFEQVEYLDFNFPDWRDKMKSYV